MTNIGYLNENLNIWYRSYLVLSADTGRRFEFWMGVDNYEEFCSGENIFRLFTNTDTAVTALPVPRAQVQWNSQADIHKPL